MITFLVTPSSYRDGSVKILPTFLTELVPDDCWLLLCGGLTTPATVPEGNAPWSQGRLGVTTQGDGVGGTGNGFTSGGGTGSTPPVHLASQPVRTRVRTTKTNETIFFIRNKLESRVLVGWIECESSSS